MFCRSYRKELQQPEKTERKLRKPKEKPSKLKPINFYPYEDYICVTSNRKPKYNFYYLNSVVPSNIASYPEFISWREKALIAQKLKEEALKPVEKPEYTKKDFDKQSKYRRVSSVYPSNLQPKSAKEALYDLIFSDYW
jgi:hypothetical protein